MVDVVRYAEKFETRDGLVSYTFPGDNLEYEAIQPFVMPVARAVGADYAHSFGGFQPWAKDLGEEAVRFIIFGASGAAADTEFDTLCQKLINTGMGKLYIKDQAAARRWAYAQLAGRPGYSTNFEAFSNIPVAMRLLRFSDWFGTAAVTGSQLCDTNPESFTINNTGNAPVKWITIRLRANAAGGFTNPAIINDTNGYSIQTLRDSASVNDEVRIDTEKGTVEYSTDDGATYADDYANAVMGATQVGLFRLEPGNNSIRVTCDGTPNVNFDYSFYPPYH